MVRAKHYWTIHTQSNSFIATANLSPPKFEPRQTRGEIVRFNLKFTTHDLVIEDNTAPTLTVNSGETYTIQSGETERYSTVEIKDGGELIINGDLVTGVEQDGYTVHNGETEIVSTINVEENGQFNVEEGGEFIATGGDNFKELQQYDDFAGNFTLNSTLNNTQKFREFLDSNADVSSLVIGIEPSQYLKDQDQKGVWGLISDGRDSRPQSLSEQKYQLTMQVLDEYSAYSDVQALKTDLEL